MVTTNFIINLATIDINQWMIFAVACEHFLSDIAIVMNTETKRSSEVDCSNMFIVITVLVALLGKTTNIVVKYLEVLKLFQGLHDHKIK